MPPSLGTLGLTVRVVLLLQKLEAFTEDFLTTPSLVFRTTGKLSVEALVGSSLCVFL